MYLSEAIAASSESPFAKLPPAETQTVVVPAPTLLGYYTKAKNAVMANPKASLGVAALIAYWLYKKK